MITVVAIFIVLMQVNIVQAGTAIKYAIVDDKAFKVQNTKGFTSIDWNAINRNIYARIFLRHAAVPVSVSVRCRSANASTLCTMPVDQHAHIQFRTLPFSLIQRVQNAFATVILFEIQGDNANALLRAGYFFQQRLPEVGGSVKEIDIIN